MKTNNRLFRFAKLDRVLTSLMVITAASAVSVSAQALEDPTSPTRAGEHFEENFLMNMIDHHAMAVGMAELCDSRADHAELIDMCHAIVTAQTNEIEMMQGWLVSWYGYQHEPMMDPEDMDEMMMLESLSGMQFEMMFLEMMIAHHDDAVKATGPCTVGAQHDELVELCESIQTVQVDEIEQMQTWLCEWYDMCAGMSATPANFVSWGEVKTLFQ
jgi:uncharacterized protein (DUF305 family)